MKMIKTCRRIFVTYKTPAILGTTIWMLMFLHPRDMWDGTIVSYASLTNDLQGIERLTSDTSLHSVYYLFRTEIFLADFFHIKFMLVDRFVVGMALVTICLCIRDFVENRCLLEAKWSSLSLSIFLTFPIWHILTSSTQTFYLVFTSMGMAGIFLIYKQKLKTTLVGLVLLLISFEMSSLIMFIPILAVVFELTETTSRKTPLRLARPFFVFSLATVYWFASRKISMPRGEYVGYNKIVSPLSIEGWTMIKSGMANYSSFLLLPSIGVSILVCTLILFRTAPDVGLSSQEKTWNSSSITVPLLVASVIPYVLVGKSTLIDDFDWSGRHAILLSIPFSIGLTLVARAVLHSVSRPRLNKFLFVCTFVVLVLPQGLIMTHGFITKYDRQEIDEQLSISLRKYQIPPGLVEIVGMPPLVPAHRDYESNYLFAETFGKPRWWTRIAPTTDPSFSIPSLTSEPDYQQMYIFKPESQLCRSLISVELTRRHRLVDRVKTLLNLKGHVKIEVVNLSSKCN